MAGVRPLQKIVAAFKPLADVASSNGAAMEVGPFAHACAHLSDLFELDLFGSELFGYVGNRFMDYVKEKDYEPKVNDLKKASESISTLKDMIELDIQQGCVTKEGSHARNLLRINRALIMMRVLCEEITNTDNENSLGGAALAAYKKVFAAHHDYGIRLAAEVAMHLLPSMSELLISLSGDEISAKVDMQSFIRTSGPVIQYIEELFNSRQLGTDW